MLACGRPVNKKSPPLNCMKQGMKNRISYPLEFTPAPSIEFSHTPLLTSTKQHDLIEVRSGVWRGGARGLVMSKKVKLFGLKNGG